MIKFFPSQYLFLLVLIMPIFLLACLNPSTEAERLEIERIQPYPDNPYYWQYKGEPLFLIGGSWQDNLFNHPVGLDEHLDLLVSVGGNYVRNVMSHRNEGNVYPYQRDDEGNFDLDKFNEEYWQRFEDFLEMTYERDIIVQMEIWDPWDLHADHQSFGGWSFHPFNPANTITYTPEESGLPTEIDYDPQYNPTAHPFWQSVPELQNNDLLLRYQKRYVDKILSYSLAYPHVLYCMNNETGEKVQWGDFWTDYVRKKSEEAGVRIEITDMRRNPNIRSGDHAHIYNNPDRYFYLEISQNNSRVSGQIHYDNILYIRDRISSHPMPLNNTKIYGSTEESIARMGRILFSGSSSARFHRPHPLDGPEAHEAKSSFGLGLSPRAQTIIQSLRMVTEALKLERMEPQNELLGSREENEAYLLAEQGVQYALYYPDGGSVTVDLSGNNDYRYRWINLDQGKWGEWNETAAGDDVQFTTPGSGHWSLIIIKV
ncbi:MAG: putative collagen-binding domain-containing protein [Balneolales bacterium]